MNSYRVAIKGVSKKNEDGISRQEIIKSIKVGDEVFLLQNLQIHMTDGRFLFLQKRTKNRVFAF